jgi:ParB family chromosome partitioning protein
MAKGLGTEFSSLIPDDMLSEALAVGQASGEIIEQLKIVDIQPNPDQPRKQFDEESLNELAVSIEEHGIIQPLVVTKKGKVYTIIAGERRWRAAGLIDLKTVPSIVRTYSKQQNLEVALIENIQREDLTLLDTAAAYSRLHDQFNLSFDEVSKKVGKSISAVHNVTRLLKLPLNAKKALHENKIVEGHARQILALKDEVTQQELLDLIIKNKWTVRQAEQYVVGHKKNNQEDKTKNALSQTKSETKETKEISSYLKTPVKVRRLAKGGQILISYKDEKHLKQLTDKLTDH